MSGYRRCNIDGILYNCESDSLVETSDGVTCTDCARCQNAPLFKHVQQYQTSSEDVASVDSCSPSILEELKHRLGLSDICVITIQQQLKAFKNTKSSYSNTQIITALHYLYGLENGQCVSVPSYIALYNGCTNLETLSKCVEYVKKIVKIGSMSTPTSWKTLIDPYRYKLLLNVSNVDSIACYCNTIYNNGNTPIYSVVIISIISHYVNEKKMCLNDVLIKVENVCGIPIESLKNMYLKASKKLLK